MSEVYIRSQNKRGIFVLNNAHGIVCEKEYDEFTELNSGIEREDNWTEKYCIYFQENGCLRKLGGYGSLERCIEIIDEIEKTCGQYLYAPGSPGLIKGSMAVPPMATVIPRVYQMPER